MKYAFHYERGRPGKRKFGGSVELELEPDYLLRLRGSTDENLEVVQSAQARLRSYVDAWARGEPPRGHGGARAGLAGAAETIRADEPDGLSKKGASTKRRKEDRQKSDQFVQGLLAELESVRAGLSGSARISEQGPELRLSIRVGLSEEEWARLKEALARRGAAYVRLNRKTGEGGYWSLPTGRIPKAQGGASEA